MTDKQKSPRIAALQALEASYQRHRHDRVADQHAAHGRGGNDHPERQSPDRHVAASDDGIPAHAARGHASVPRRRLLRVKLRANLRRPIVRKILLGIASTLAVVAFVVIGLWWRLASGPITIDLVTPWLAAAIEQNLGKNHSVEIGGTQLERDASGRAALRIRDIVVHDADKNVVAVAPKAEVSVSGTSLLMGRLRARRLSLVGAELAVRIERDGQVTISAGADKTPLAITPAIVKSAAQRAAAAAAARSRHENKSNTDAAPG
ncbi:MAG: hypothetical protein HY659_07900, partial [Rhizobiales bacterium]|nr:hypothetical protein [Hyphomicrobiales bacterium]